MCDVHVIVISSVIPEPTSAGQLLLHRHLVDQPGLTYHVCRTERRSRSLAGLARRILRRLSATRLHRFVEDIQLFWGGRWIDAELPSSVPHPERTVVLTVAHGDAFMAARRFAHRHGLPLISFFHDWWPDIPRVHAPFRRLIDHRFHALAKNSDAAFCVCEGMVTALGANPQATVLYPIPSQPNMPRPRLQDEPKDDFKVAYFGNLADYGPMLGDALETSLNHPGIRLEVRGANPAWPEARKTRMRACGRWLEFAPRAELDGWLASADAFLVAMLFDPGERRRMETSFPSKLVEFAQLGKPIIIWGPEYCSAVRWARDGDKALCVTTDDPKKLLDELGMLRGNFALIERLAAESMAAAEDEFSPNRLQQRFRTVLDALVSGEPVTTGSAVEAIRHR